MNRRAVTLLILLGLLLGVVGCTTRITPTPLATSPPPTAVPPTAVPPTDVPPTAVPPTAVPPTAVPPTAVPTDTETPVPPSATPSATPVIPTHTPVPTATPTPSGPESPQLLAPPNDLVACLFDLMWDWERKLGKDEWFEVQIWPDHPDAKPEVFQWLQGTTMRTTSAHLSPGRYRWRVAVVGGRVDDRGQELSPYSGERTFVMALPSTVTSLSIAPAATLAPVPTVECPLNAVYNGNFEGGFSARGAADVIVGNGWHPWWKEGPYQSQGYNKQPEYKPADVSQLGGKRVYEGNFSQEWSSTDATHHAGVFQQIYVPSNSVVTVSAWAQAWSSEEDDPTISEGGKYSMRVGIDPYGGTNWRSLAIVWFARDRTLDEWVHLSVQARARRNVVTIYLRGDAEGRVKHNNVYFDGVCVTHVVATPGPTIYWWPSLTPTSQPTLPPGTIPPPDTPTPPGTLPAVTSTPTGGATVPAPTSTPTSDATLPVPTSTPTTGGYPGATNTPSSPAATATATTYP